MRLAYIALVLCLQSVLSLHLAEIAFGDEPSPKPLRALLIAGGCCHDYANQQKIIAEGIQARANIQVDVYWTDNSSTAPVLPLYQDPDWAKQYDVIIHDECGADIKDTAIVDRILNVHQKIPAVHLHCAMHSFRTGTDAWFTHLGLQSNSHGPQEPIDIHFTDTNHPITQTLRDWTTIREELYNNVKVFGARSLAVGKQNVGDRVDEAIVVWTNETQGARSFSTSLGHNTDTVKDERYLELITRGTLWACDKLSPQYLTPFNGQNVTTFIDKNLHQADAAMDLGETPKDATLVKVSASSTQPGNELHHAIDGKTNTRWCAADSSYPQWLQFEFNKPHALSEIKIDWESGSGAYRYKVEGSSDAMNWITLLDQSANSSSKQSALPLSSNKETKYLRITGLGSTAGWCSIREVTVKGEGIAQLWPADPKSNGQTFVPIKPDPYVKQGNLPPTIVRLTSAEEAEILKDVKVAEGFEATLFASPPAVNYPVFVAADVDGTLYVSSDGNGSLGRDPKRGRVIRLRDIDGDGRADETKVFCEIDAPRGLVWDHDRLYVMHPPHLSAFIDKDGDGVADEQKILVKNLAFGYDQRPADHTTNGVSLGVDGWLYIAGGDFGFLNAEGSDGRKLTHRGGGVIRVRPDGTGLEIYSTGTRNILEVAISPQMDMFARDNTNDGGGWDVRLHHFTGNDDHGYPRLYMNFKDECVQPLADYGGGSGCGAVYIDEPGFAAWNNAPFTADWGTGALYRHTVVASGATFQETKSPEPLIRMTRPTDADVDGSSRVYCASWRGATFAWEGTKVGYIVCVRPKNFTPEPLPDFAKATDNQLVAIMQSASHRRRLEASRELMRRGNSEYQSLHTSAVATRNEARNLVAKLQGEAKDHERIAALSSNDPVVVHTAIQSLAKHRSIQALFNGLDQNTAPSHYVLRALAMIHDPSVVDGLLLRLKTCSKPELRHELLSALCRLHHQEGVWKGDSWGTRPDTRGPYYQPEPWSESPKIASALQKELESSSPQDTAALVAVMRRNRIESGSAIERLLQLAEKDPTLHGSVIEQLLTMSEIPQSALPILKKVALNPNSESEHLSETVSVLSKIHSAEAKQIALTALAVLESRPNAAEHCNRASQAFVRTSHLDQFVSVFEAACNEPDPAKALWANVALMTIASNPNSSPEANATAKLSLGNGWSEPKRRMQLISAVAHTGDRSFDKQILESAQDSDAKIANLAKQVVEKLKIVPAMSDSSSKLSGLAIADVIATVTAKNGDVDLGQAIFTKANCVACHTVRSDEPLKGPFLGNIAKTYKREELATAILDPSKTIAQGFVTNLFLTADGVVVTGFVTNELSETVTLRDGQGKEVTIDKDDIEERKTSTTSVMPNGLMNDFTTHELSSLIDYLQSLSSESPKP